MTWSRSGSSSSSSSGSSTINSIGSNSSSNMILSATAELRHLDGGQTKRLSKACVVAPERRQAIPAWSSGIPGCSCQRVSVFRVVVARCRVCENLKSLGVFIRDKSDVPISNMLRQEVPLVSKAWRKVRWFVQCAPPAVQGTLCRTRTKPFAGPDQLALHSLDLHSLPGDTT